MTLPTIPVILFESQKMKQNQNSWDGKMDSEQYIRFNYIDKYLILFNTEKRLKASKRKTEIK